MVAAELAGLALLLAWPPAARRSALARVRRSPPRWLRGRADAAAPRTPAAGRRGARVGRDRGPVGGQGRSWPSGAACWSPSRERSCSGGWSRPRPGWPATTDADTPQALDLLASCLAAGLPVRSALRAVVEVIDGPLADDLGQVLRLTKRSRRRLRLADAGPPRPARPGCARSGPVRRDRRSAGGEPAGPRRGRTGGTARSGRGGSPAGRCAQRAAVDGLLHPGVPAARHRAHSGVGGAERPALLTR